MTVMWAASVRRRNISLVDRAWGSVFVVLAVTYATTGPAVTGRARLVMGLVTLWGLRLTVYLVRRDWGQGEDWRHRRLRDQWGRATAWRSLLLVFWFQAVAAVSVSTPLLAVFATHQRTLGMLDLVGFIAWTVGFACEAIGDHQLTRFRARPGHQEPFLRTGLWRYTRHPNYFGDALQWWGLGLIGLAAGAWWSLLGPLGMTVVLLRVTGVTVMDEHLLATKGPAYADYVHGTSSFAPRPPRRSVTTDTADVAR
jgi:steroid 5-alpha reductase family enzyme